MYPGTLLARAKRRRASWRSKTKSSATWITCSRFRTRAWVVLLKKSQGTEAPGGPWAKLQRPNLRNASNRLTYITWGITLAQSTSNTRNKRRALKRVSQPSRKQGLHWSNRKSWTYRSTKSSTAQTFWASSWIRRKAARARRNLRPSPQSLVRWAPIWGTGSSNI